MIQVVIGIIFVLLLFSLLATTIMELLAGLLALRGKQLLNALRNMLSEKTGAFIEHPYFQQLSQRGSKSNPSKLPSYINAGSFSSILFDVLEIGSIAEAEARITQIQNVRLRKVMSFLLRQSGGNVLVFRVKVEEWFNEVMERASGWYKRRTQLWLFGVGLAIALIFNADAINIYHNLSVNATLRDFVASQATNYVNTQAAPQGVTGTMGYEAAREQIGTLLKDDIAAIRSPLGLGWDTVDWSKANGKWWIFKLIGWLVTALAVSLGAPFWFDLLKKIVNMRSAGPTPAPATATSNVPQGTLPAQTGALASTSGGGGSFLTKPGPDSPLESLRQPNRPPNKRRKPRNKPSNPNQEKKSEE